MPAPKKATTFDAHLGKVVNGLAGAHGGREWLAALLDISKKTVDRRVIGATGFTVKELEVIADAVNMPAADIVDVALKNYGDGDRAAGLARLRAEDDTPTNVGDVHEDEYEVTPSGPNQSDHALAANTRPKKVNRPAAE